MKTAYEVYPDSWLSRNQEPQRDINQLKLCLEDIERTKNRQWIRATASVIAMLTVFSDPMRQLLARDSIAGTSSILRWALLSIYLSAATLQLESFWSLLTHRKMKTMCRPHDMDWRLRHWPPPLNLLYILSAYFPLLAVCGTYVICEVRRIEM